MTRTVDVRIVQAGNWENVASVSSPLDPVPGNNDGSSPDNKTTVTTGDPAADLEVTKSGPTVASVGDTISYLITTKNLGPVRPARWWSGTLSPRGGLCRRKQRGDGQRSGGDLAGYDHSPARRVRGGHRECLGASGRFLHERGQCHESDAGS